MTMLVSRLENLKLRPRRVAIGQFDGVHRGHRAVIRGADTVVTFEPHPKTVVSPGPPPPTLSSLAHKARLLQTLGVRELVVIEFDRDRASQTAESFVDDVLVERLNATEVAVGANFRYGRGAKGDVATLRADGRFSVRVADLLAIGGAPVSSTRIRALIAAGDVAGAADLLGSSLRLHGTVQCAGADGDFRELGALVAFPAHVAVPPPGEYAGDVRGDPTRLVMTDLAGNRPHVGWLTGQAVDVCPGSTVEIDLESSHALTTAA